MARVQVNDLCYSCRAIPAENGVPVGDMLNIFYTNPQKHMEWGDAAVCKMLLVSIVEGDGCTICGEKVLNWAESMTGRAKY